jgi:hypothetical protein
MSKNPEPLRGPSRSYVEGRGVDVIAGPVIGGARQLGDQTGPKAFRSTEELRTGVELGTSLGNDAGPWTAQERTRSRAGRSTVPPQPGRADR